MYVDFSKTIDELRNMYILQGSHDKGSREVLHKGVALRPCIYTYIYVSKCKSKITNLFLLRVPRKSW